MIFMTETFLDSFILPDNVNLDIPGYNVVIADNSANNKSGGRC